MRLFSKDGKRSVDLGRSDIWKAVYSTVVACLGKNRKKYLLAFEFFESGKCDGNRGYDVARQINLIRDDLSQYAPDKAVYDIDNPKMEAPWKGKLSPVITSCANLFTTSDGQDLLYEIVAILCYAQVAKTSVELE